ncbi:MAG: hypothetical protein CMD18_05035 [Flavobacteriales bacterium]|nr:hypothetical protein [Flavobacteriales bacterium]
MPIVFYLVQEIFMRFKINGGLSALKILIGVLYFSFLFEFLLPQFSPKFTADWLDVLMYFLGGVIYFILKITLKPSMKNS